MTVKLNEAALVTLLETQQGPVGQLVKRKAEEVTAQARTNAGQIMINYPGDATGGINYAIDAELNAVIGINDSRRISQYLADKAAGLLAARGEELFAEGWLRAALRGFGS